MDYRSDVLDLNIKDDTDEPMWAFSIFTHSLGHLAHEIAHTDLNFRQSLAIDRYANVAVLSPHTCEELRFNSPSGVSRHAYAFDAPSSTARRQRLAEIFEVLRRNWISEVQTTSSMTEIILNRNYQRIIGLGPSALPLILSDLNHELNHWFWALEMITGQAPYSEEIIGTPSKMREAWLAWGRAKSLL